AVAPPAAPTMLPVSVRSPVVRSTSQPASEPATNSRAKIHPIAFILITAPSFRPLRRAARIGFGHGLPEPVDGGIVQMLRVVLRPGDEVLTNLPERRHRLGAGPGIDHAGTAKLKIEQAGPEDKALTERRRSPRWTALGRAGTHQ